ncbi:MAG: type IV secretory system conjugative DNA transfer family protein, partial [Clostridium sp.]|nr:type IV secretory system conjugative DNA transfer family protein [Clostridium sp.]
MKKLPKINPAKGLKAALPYLMIGLMATKFGQAYRMASGKDILDKVLGTFLTVGEAFQNPFPSLYPFDLMVGAGGSGLLWLIVYQKKKNARKYRRGAEYGTARWGNEKDIEPFIAPDFSQNILLSETERLTLGKIADPEKRNVNLNVLVIGGSGSGKTRYHIKPNLLQMNASYLCSDPKGTLIEEVGQAMLRGGYRIKLLNTIDFSSSMHYNPFVYLHSETDILTLVTVIMTNTQGEAKGGDGFWEKAEALLYQALIAYIYYEAPSEEKNMTTLLDMLNACECREDDENFKSAVDLMFEQLEKRNPDHFAVRQYRKFKMAAGVVCSKRLLNQAVGKSLRTHNLKPKKGAQV